MSPLLLFVLACVDDTGDVRSSRTGDADPADTDTDTNGGDTDTGGDDTGEPVPDVGELRGIWVDRWTFSDAADIEDIMAKSAAAGFNTVFFQVRGNADAYYDSAWEPWAKGLTGTLGADPGWDPLQTAVESGHAHGLEVHAYLNAFPFWTGTTPPTESTPRHAYLEHPEWLVADSSGTPMALNASYVWMSPGNPEVRQRLADVAADVADHYDVDGIHLDLVRYPGSQYSHDAVSRAAWDGSDYAAWQRRQVVEAVAGVYAVSDVPVTAAVWGVYENDWGWSSVSQGNVDYYQDSRAMLAEGALDALAPMVYWPVTDTPGERLDFATLIADHVAHDSGRYVFAGINAEDFSWEEELACIEASRAAGARGYVIFDWGLVDAYGWWDELAAVNAEPTTLPTYPWR